MFGEIAGRYDLMNHLLSGGVDILWRKKVVRMAATGREENVLDLACGTGDLAIELRKAMKPDCRIVGADFTHEMLEKAVTKTPKNPGASLTWVEADGLRLPFADETFDLVTIGFGIRNMASLDGALLEMGRVLRPGGRLAILECTTPRSWFYRTFYQPYFLYVLPRIGALLSQKSAYLYLPHSVVHFTPPKELVARMEKCGYANVRFESLMMEAAAIHVGEKKS
ncbi:bifunctional demethylmenaquinone methyltransferase/2-methoxy-6-polyprenyl-1,4-benzoquinol methylase UbiE [soil metagenome]